VEIEKEIENIFVIKVKRKIRDREKNTQVK
jgi:hypothetical protein